MPFCGECVWFSEGRCVLPIGTQRDVYKEAKACQFFENKNEITQKEFHMNQVQFEDAFHPRWNPSILSDLRTEMLQELDRLRNILRDLDVSSFHNSIQTRGREHQDYPSAEYFQRTFVNEQSPRERLRLRISLDFITFYVNPFGKCGSCKYCQEIIESDDDSVLIRCSFDFNKIGSISDRKECWIPSEDYQRWALKNESWRKIKLKNNLEILL